MLLIPSQPYLSLSPRRVHRSKMQTRVLPSNTSSHVIDLSATLPSTSQQTEKSHAIDLLFQHQCIEAKEAIYCSKSCDVRLDQSQPTMPTRASAPACSTDGTRHHPCPMLGPTINIDLFDMPRRCSLGSLHVDLENIACTIYERDEYKMTMRSALQWRYHAG
jgi:hypothetical protein